MRCLTSAKYTMRADILRQVSGVDSPSTPTTDEGTWTDQQDPLTGDIIRVWVPGDNTSYPEDNPDTEGVEADTIDLMVRGIVSGGITLTGTGEQFGEQYISTDYARAKFSPNVVITKRDRLTNIRDKRTGRILWKEEEIAPDAGYDYKATVFEVVGVTPLFDSFGRHTENVAFLERAEVQ